MNWYKQIQSDAQFPVAQKRQLVSAIVQVKGTLIDDGGQMSAIAPHKFIWKNAGMHEVSVWYERGWKKNEVYAELLRDVQGGVEPCPDQECEWCNEPPGLPFGVNQNDCLVINGKINELV